MQGKDGQTSYISITKHTGLQPAFGILTYIEFIVTLKMYIYPVLEMEI
jgi:hypothetical protein